MKCASELLCSPWVLSEGCTEWNDIVLFFLGGFIVKKIAAIDTNIYLFNCTTSNNFLRIKSQTSVCAFVYFCLWRALFKLIETKIQI